MHWNVMIHFDLGMLGNIQKNLFGQLFGGYLNQYLTLNLKQNKTKKQQQNYKDTATK